MKKYIYLCCILLLNMELMSQVVLGDNNWDILFLRISMETEVGTIYGKIKTMT